MFRANSCNITRLSPDLVHISRPNHEAWESPFRRKFSRIWLDVSLWSQGKSSDAQTHSGRQPAEGLSCPFFKNWINIGCPPDRSEESFTSLQPILVSWGGADGEPDLLPCESFDPKLSFLVGMNPPRNQSFSLQEKASKGAVILIRFSTDTKQASSMQNQNP